MKILAIIPARFASTRFPAKLLADLGGKSVLQRVFERVQGYSHFDEVIIATDDKRILEHAQSFKAKVLMTSDTHRSGTDRCAEVVNQFPNFDIIVNVQGDEPFIAHKQLDRLIAPFFSDLDVQIATLAKKIEDPESLFNPNVVKVVFDSNQKALYFSRNPIPFVRGKKQDEWLGKAPFYKHIGLYAFRGEALKAVTMLESSSFELAESLEQLRWLQNGYSVQVGITNMETIGIDTPEDLEKAKKYLDLIS